MNHVRYKQRDCKDMAKIIPFLEETRVGVIGMVSEGLPYAVPVNYVWHKGCIYFHGMGSGKKVSILSMSPQVTFTVFKEHGTVTDPMPCKADTAYMSAMIFGQAQKVADFEEAAEVLQKILEKYTPGFYKTPMSAGVVEKYKSSHDNNRVAVYKILPIDLTAKENAAEDGQIFK